MFTFVFILFKQVFFLKMNIDEHEKIMFFAKLNRILIFFLLKYFYKSFIICIYFIRTCHQFDLLTIVFITS